MGWSSVAPSGATSTTYHMYINLCKLRPGIYTQITKHMHTYLEKQPQNHGQKHPKTSLWDVFLGTRGHPGSVSAKSTLIPRIFNPKISILNPRGDPKNVNFIIFSVKIPVSFPIIFQNQILMVFSSISDPPDP